MEREGQINTRLTIMRPKLLHSAETVDTTHTKLTYIYITLMPYITWALLDADSADTAGAAADVSGYS